MASRKLSLWLAALVGAVFCGAGLADHPSAAEVAQLRSQCQAAKMAFEGLRKEAVNSVPPALSASAYENLYRWSRRWMKCEQALAKTRAERVSAAKAHLARVQEFTKIMLDLIKTVGKEPGGPTESMAAYYRLSAQVAVKRAGAGK